MGIKEININQLFSKRIQENLDYGVTCFARRKWH